MVAENDNEGSQSRLPEIEDLVHLCRKWNMKQSIGEKDKLDLTFLSTLLKKK
jgi:hypothetical protein